MKIVEHTVTPVIYSDTVHWQKEIPNVSSMNVLPKSNQLIRNLAQYSVCVFTSESVDETLRDESY